MPINQEIWEIDGAVEKTQEISLDNEYELETILEKNIEILNTDWLVIGRQVITDFNKRIDLLAIDINGDLVVIELKKNKTTRDVVAQSIDYAAWIEKQGTADIENIYKNYQEKYLGRGEIYSLGNGLNEKFNVDFQEDEINNAHKIIIVASELDNHTERIVNYLLNSEIPINVVFFKVVKIGDKRVLSRAWLTDPEETDESASNKKIVESNKIPWNGEFYVSFGQEETRNWEDARKYGFISGGGKPWYSRTLSLLSTDDRVWVNIPHTGYVGVGTVTEPVQMAKDMIFEVEGKEASIYDLETIGNYRPEYKEDEDKSEYIVKVAWIKTVKVSEAIKELGFFGNQNTVCKPANSKWTFTVDYLKRKWNIE